MAADRITYQSGFGNTFSTEALKNALSLSSERRAEVARAAQEQVRSRYGLAQANRQLLQLYERLG